MTVWRRFPNLRRRAAERSTADENTAQSTLAGDAAGDPGRTSRAPASSSLSAPANSSLALGPQGVAPYVPPADCQVLWAHNVFGANTPTPELLRRSREAERNGNIVLAQVFEGLADERFQQRRRVGL